MKFIFVLILILFSCSQDSSKIIINSEAQKAIQDYYSTSEIVESETNSIALKLFKTFVNEFKKDNSLFLIDSTQNSFVGLTKSGTVVEVLPFKENIRVTKYLTNKTISSTDELIVTKFSYFLNENMKIENSFSKQFSFSNIKISSFNNIEEALNFVK